MQTVMPRWFFFSMSILVTKIQKKQICLFIHSLLHINTNTPTKTKRTHLCTEPNRVTGLDVRRLCNSGKLNEAIHILQVMDAPLDSSTYVCLLQGCLNKKTLSLGKLMHAHLIQAGFKSGLYLDNLLIIMYDKLGSLADARKVFEEMPERNVVSWTAMISGYARYGFGKEAIEFFRQMKKNGIQPNQFSYSSMIPVCARMVALGHGKEVHCDIIKAGFESSVFVASSLIDMYRKCRNTEDACKVFDKMPKRNVVSWTAMVAGYAQSGCLDKALELFERMPERNVVSWTAIIAGCAQNGQFHEALKLFWEMPERHLTSWNAMISGYAQHDYFAEALELFRQMQSTGVKANSVTLTSLLPACACLAALRQGREVHEDIIRSGFLSDVFVGNALVDMYAKCGSIEDAQKLFSRMTKRDVVSWSSLIVGYAMHGSAYDALQLFKQMQCSGTKPDHITFVGVLSACCHAGLVSDACHYFRCMSKDYHIRPSVEHYTCMVDLLGRAGHLNEAWDIIQMMPMKADAIVWGALLGACQIHSNVELGEIAAERLFEMDPENPAHYVLLSNIYASVGRWDGFKRVRRMMKDRKVKKTPGLSWIGVNNKVNTFVVGNMLHPYT
ncbi:hypothetical protein SUGI_0474350 [Cryptomeria japonica]|uniref:pentatricopeptide repeat-containing protein At4g02750 n=1 Tax=Cryptomeria japonica TaxID=3369 RepID=UPI002408A21D|nr:pentatricopeptide repeat-containing protein At4g02750 [Cryptomeria japonica]GLJ24805.1 hypothetical protein SUGI_0474350 [Cryptomeria japonica]